MRITHISSFFWPVKGGMESHVQNLCNELVKSGNEVKVFTSDSARAGKAGKKDDSIDGVTVKRFPTWLKISQFTPVFPGLLGQVIFDNSEILHVHSYRQFHNLAIILGKLSGKKVVFTTHWPEYPESARNSLLNACIKIFDSVLGKFMLDSADKIIAQVELEKKWLAGKFNIPEGKIDVIPPGIPESYLAQRNKNNFRKKFKIKERNIVLCVGRMHKSKGFDKIIKICKDFVNTKFVFAGPDGGFRNELENLAKNLGVSDKVLFAGEISEEEKLEAYSGCDVFILPSDYEAFGLVLLEAMAQNAPVIAANAGGMPDVVGNCGFVFEKDNLADLKEKLQRLLSDKKLRIRLGKLAKEKARELTWKNQAQKVERIYKSLLLEN